MTRFSDGKIQPNERQQSGFAQNTSSVEEFLAQPDRFTESLMARRGLFPRRAGIHVDFHTYRHFDNPWGLPGHFGLLAHLDGTLNLRPLQS
jgi:hypothetical protein